MKITDVEAMVLESPDEPNVVMHWYYQQRFAEADKDPNRGLATTRFTVESGPGDTGSTILERLPLIAVMRKSRIAGSHAPVWRRFRSKVNR